MYLLHKINIYTNIKTKIPVKEKIIINIVSSLE